MYESWREHTTSSSVNFSACTPHSMGTSNAVCTGPGWTCFCFAAFIQLPVWETTPLPFRCFIQNEKTFSECAGLSVGLAPCHSIRIRMQYRTISSQPWVFFTELEFKTGKFFQTIRVRNYFVTSWYVHLRILTFDSWDFFLGRLLRRVKNQQSLQGLEFFHAFFWIWHNQIV